MTRSSRDSLQAFGAWNVPLILFKCYSIEKNVSKTNRLNYKRFKFLQVTKKEGADYLNFAPLIPFEMAVLNDRLFSRKEDGRNKDACLQLKGSFLISGWYPSTLRSIYYQPFLPFSLSLFHFLDRDRYSKNGKNNVAALPPHCLIHFTDYDKWSRQIHRRHLIDMIKQKIVLYIRTGDKLI